MVRASAGVFEATIWLDQLPGFLHYRAHIRTGESHFRVLRRRTLRRHHTAFKEAGPPQLENEFLIRIVVASFFRDRLDVAIRFNLKPKSSNKGNFPIEPPVVPFTEQTRVGK